MMALELLCCNFMSFRLAQQEMSSVDVLANSTNSAMEVNKGQTYYAGFITPLCLSLSFFSYLGLCKT